MKNENNIDQLLVGDKLINIRFQQYDTIDTSTSQVPNTLVFKIKWSTMVIINQHF